jgi:glycosyltransferase involved in cell wall biosynthesis
VITLIIQERDTCNKPYIPHNKGDTCGHVREGGKMIEKNPLVSVGIPTYNRPEGLRRTLECITGQTYRNLEIIVADNYSPGTATQEIVQLFMEKDSRIIYYRHEKNFGMDYNSMFTIRKATGNFFMSAADDDEWYPEYIEKCIAPMIADDSVLFSMSNVILALDPVIRKIKSASGNDTICPPGNQDLSPYWKLTESFHTHGLAPLLRIKKIILNSGQNGAYGIHRMSYLKKTVFDPSFHSEWFGSDRSFLARLNLSGSIYQVPEYLFIYHHGFGASCVNPEGMKNRISRWQYYGLKIYPILTGYINMIIDSLSWPVSTIDHIKIVSYYLARMVKAKTRRYTAKDPFIGIPYSDYMPPKYPPSAEKSDRTRKIH